MSSPTATKPCVRDAMSRNPIFLDPGATVRELAETLEANNISGVPVVNSQERVIGVVTKTDLIHRILEGPLGSRPGSFFSALAEGLVTGSDFDAETLGTVEEFMTTDPVTASPDEALAAVAHRMAEDRVHRVIVVDEEQRPIGMVTTLDLLRFFPI